MNQVHPESKRFSFIPITITLLISLFWLSCKTDTVLTDPQGHTYKTIKIGEQTWTAENLKYMINEESFCYNDDANECDTMGRLYTWEGAIKAADEIPGWHLPNKTEWDHFLDLCGEDSLAYSQIVSEEFGFSPQWSGVRLASGKYVAKRYKGVNYWSSATADTSKVLAYSVAIMSNIKKISSHNYPKLNACSVRLVKDQKE